MSKYEFIGTLQLPNARLITYKNEFLEEKNGEITGNSITDIFGPNKTQSIIKGTINHSQNQISFYETENINTKSDAVDSDFCYLHISNARIKSIRNKTIIQGTFNGLYKTGKLALTGNIYLISQTFLNEIESNLNKQKTIEKDSLNRKNDRKKDTKKTTTKRLELCARKQLAIDWSSNEIILSVWDAEKLDQDKINVYVNDKIILEDFIIKKAKKVIVIPFDGKTCLLKIKAVNEGDIPPNTVTGELLDGETIIPFVSSLNKGEFSSILLKKP